MKSFISAVKRGDISGIRRRLRKRKSDLNNKNELGETAIYASVLNGHKEVTKLLLDNGADVNEGNHRDQGKCPIHVCALRGQGDMLKLLLDNNATDLNRKTKDGWTALHFCAQYGHLDILIMLLDHGADVDATTNFGCTPLHFGSKKGHVETVKTLLDRGANLESSTTFGYTALHFAVTSLYTSRENGRYMPDVVQLLLDRNAVTSAKTMAGETPLDLALTPGVRLLLRNHFRKRQEIFNAALNTKEKLKWNRSKIIFVGPEAVGKSATVRSLLGKGFDPLLETTNGMEISEGCTSSSEACWKQSGERKADYASSFASRVMLKNIQLYPLKTSPAKLPLKSLGNNKVNGGTRSKSMFSKISTVSITPFATEKQRIVNSRNKTLPPSRLSKQYRIKRDFREELIVESNENSIELSLWDFGGQEISYSIAHLYFTKGGTYVIVFDLRKILQPSQEKKAIEDLEFWLKSIKINAPQASILLVGTFFAELEGRESLRRINSSLQKIGKEFIPQIVANSQERLLFFPIDNKEHLGIDMLRSTIVTASTSEEFNVEVPLNWMAFLDEILSHRKSSPYITLSKIKLLAFNCGVYSQSEQEEALRLFHEKGNIAYLTATENMKNTVIIKPQWIVSQLSKLIRAESSDTLDTADIEKVGLKDDFRRTFRNSITSHDFLVYIWNNDRVDFLIDFMKQTMLLSDWKAGKNRLYLIPSLLQESLTNEKDFTGAIRFMFDFSDSYLPNGIFQALVCLCLAQSTRVSCSKLEPKILMNYASIEYEPGLHLKLYEDPKKENCISVYVNDCKYATKSLNIIQSMLQKMKYEIMRSRIHWKVFVENLTTGALVSLNEANTEELFPWHVAEENEPKGQADLESFLTSL